MFPNLTSLYLDSGVGRRPTELPLVLSEGRKGLEAARKLLSTIGREAWVEPGFHLAGLEEIPRNTFGINRLLALVEACASAGRTITLLSVEGLDLRHIQQKIELPPTPNMRAFLEGLNHLIIDNRSIGTTSTAWEHTATLLGHAVSLKSLEVRRPGEDHDVGHGDRSQGSPVPSHSKWYTNLRL